MSLPVSITILQTVAGLMERYAEMLDSGSDEFQTFITNCQKSDEFGRESWFYDASYYLGYVQTLMLAGVSMLGGASVPVINDFTFENDEVTISWDTGTRDRFRIGVYDDDFRAFSKYFHIRALQHPQATYTIATPFFLAIKSLVESYSLVLSAVEERLQVLLSGREKALEQLKTPANQDLMFIILSSLPTDQMNALFIHIQNFFPKDLEITTPSGNRVNVCSMFQTQSTDVRYLIEKTQVYMDLYFSNRLPIIQEITRTKTFDFLKKLVDNTAMYNATISNLKSLKAHQVDLRLSLYRMLSQHLVQYSEL